MNTKSRSMFVLSKLTFALASCAIGAAPACAAPFAYVPAGSAVSVVDTATNTVTTTIPTAATATALAITPDGKFVYVSEYVLNAADGNVEVIATATNTVVANIPVAAPGDIAASPNGQLSTSAISWQTRSR